MKTINVLIVPLSLIVFGIGYCLGRYDASENISTRYGCNQIARFHADLLMRSYGIDFNEIKEDVNVRASDLNVHLLRTCMVDPR